MPKVSTPVLELKPWHLDRSYLSSGWCSGGNTYSPVLPDVRQQLSGRTGDKEMRPRSAGARRAQALAPAAERVGRLLPLPRPRDISGLSSVADGVFKEASLSSDAKLAQALTTQTPEGQVGAKLERLRLTDHHWLSGAALAKAAPSLGLLKELSLRGTKVENDTLSAFVAGCPKIAIVDVSLCALLTDLSCISQLTGLRELRASQCPAVSESFVASLGALRELEVVDLSYSSGVTDEALVQMASGCSRISRLCLDSCPNIAGSGLIAVTEANPGIRHLSLSLNSGFSDEAAAQAIFWLKRVRLVNFAGCPRLHRLLPSALAKNCELLEDLSLAGCTLLRDEALRCLLISCPHLESLNLSKCPCLTAAPFLEVLPMMRSRLRRLCLTHVPAISEQAVSAIYSAAAAGAGGDGTFDSRALVAALQAASYEEEDEDEDGDDRSDDDGDDEDPAGGDAAPAAFSALAAAAAESAAGRGALGGASQLVIERFAQRPTDPLDLKHVLHIWRRSKETKRGKKRGKSKGGKKKK